MSGKFEEISVKITRNFGAVTIEVGHSAGYEIDNRDKRNAVYQSVMAMLQKQIDEFSRDGLNAPAPAPLIGDMRTEVLSDGAFVGEMKNGEILVKWVGGKYSKWGVPVYDEVLKHLPFNGTDYLQKGGVVADGYTVHIEVEGNKPKRVSKVEQP